MVSTNKWRAFFTPVFKKKFGDVLKVSCGAAITFCGVALYSNNENFYKSFVMPAFHLLDPESAHNIAVKITEYKMIPKSRVVLKSLESRLFDHKFASPIGVAAGYDKNGECVEGLFKMGFTFVEVGSVTPLPQPGNAKPRLFRLCQIEGILNRYGFNSDGHDVVYDRLSKLAPRGKRNGILGVNLGKNKDSEDAIEDYVLGVRKFIHIADYLVVNISSPNTPGLRKLQQKSYLEVLLLALKEEKDKVKGIDTPPLLLKVSPDLTYEEKENIAKIVLDKKSCVDGLIISNTTITRPFNADIRNGDEAGGLSGKPLKDLANTTMADFYKLTKGKMPLIGSGGISSGSDALERIKNGASLIQIYSALVFDGPPLVDKIQTDLDHLLRSEGFETLNEAVGTNVKV